MKKIARLVLLSALLIALWQGIISLFDVPPYLLPAPLAVWQRLMTQADLLFMHAQITLLEILLGLVLGFLFGLSSALLLTLSRKINALFRHLHPGIILFFRSYPQIDGTTLVLYLR